MTILLPLAAAGGNSSGYRAVISGSTGDGFKTGAPLLLNYASSDLVHWTFSSVLFEGSSDCGPRAECANYFELDGAMVLLVSCPSKGNDKLCQRDDAASAKDAVSRRHGVLPSSAGHTMWYIGTENATKGFVPSASGIIDNGDAYAGEHALSRCCRRCCRDCHSQRHTAELIDPPASFPCLSNNNTAASTALDEDNRRLIMLWARDGLTPTDQQASGYANWESLPRELSIDGNGYLASKPIEDLLLYADPIIQLHNVHVDDGVYQVSLPAGLERQFLIQVRNEAGCSRDARQATSGGRRGLVAWHAADALRAH